MTLYESPVYAITNFEGINPKQATLHVTGALSGNARLEAITTDLASAVQDAQVIMVCTVVQAHEQVAMALAPLVTPDHVVVLNPGATRRRGGWHRLIANTKAGECLVKAVQCVP